MKKFKFEDVCWPLNLCLRDFAEQSLHCSIISRGKERSLHDFAGQRTKALWFCGAKSALLIWHYLWVFRVHWHFFRHSKSWRASKSLYWFKSYGDFAEWVDFAYWLRWIGKGLPCSLRSRLVFLNPDLPLNISCVGHLKPDLRLK